MLNGHYSFPLAPPLHMSFSGSAAILWGCSSSPTERPTQWGREVFCQKPSRYTILEGTPPVCQAFRDCSTSQQLSCNFMRDPKPEPPIQATLSFLTHRNYKILSVHCLKPWSFGLICEAAIDNYYKDLVMNIWIQEKWTEGTQIAIIENKKGGRPFKRQKLYRNQ